MSVFCKYQGNGKGKQIYDKLVDMGKRRDDDSSRKAHNLGPTSDLYPVVAELEQELLSELAKH